MKKLIVVSGINLYSGGPLSIYLDFLSSVTKKGYDKKYNIVAFVHKKELFYEFEKSKIKFIELPKSRKSYLNRLFYEYVWFYEYSKKHNVYLWISLHDITPNVAAKKRMVYCHSPLLFLKITPEIVRHYPGTALMKFLYKYVYALNIKKNDCVIVQQEWMRREFCKLYGLKRENIAVCKPIILEEKIKNRKRNENEPFVFLYAAYPRFFKNYEVIAKAVKILNKQRQDFKVIFTVNGSENQYSRRLYAKYHDVHNIEWRGLVSREEMFELYGKVDALIFPSLLETWGLPISEFKLTGKLIILSDLPYAHEAVQPYDKAVFFNPNDEVSLSRLMTNAIDGMIDINMIEDIHHRQPYYENWNEFLQERF